MTNNIFILLIYFYPSTHSLTDLSDKMEDMYISIKQALGESVVYMDIEDDGTLLLESLRTQFQGAIGLKFEFHDSFRAVRVRNGVLLPPRSGWDAKSYHVVFGEQDNPQVKTETSNVDAVMIERSSGTESVELTVKKGMLVHGHTVHFLTE